MQNFNNVILNSLNYYDASLEKYSKLLKYKRELLYDDIKNSYIIKFLNVDGSVVFSSKCEIIGKYDLLNGYWLWAWADNNYEGAIMQYSKKILNYGLNIENSKLRDHFINSKIYINSNPQLDVHLALILYILKKQLIVATQRTFSLDTIYLDAEKKENYNVPPIRLNIFVVPTEMEKYENNIKKTSSEMETETGETETTKKDSKISDKDYDTDTEDN